jgi:hypothetical protein
MKTDFNKFVRRQTTQSPFSHWTHDDASLLALVEANFDRAKPGYRDGVILVPVNPSGFFSSVIALKAGDKLTGEYKARREGEEPRQSVYAQGDKIPALSVDIVLYRNDVLGDDATTEADWEIVSINASPTEGEAPIQPMTLIANHYGIDGGTPTNMSAEQFEAALRESVLYWKDKALAG